MATILWAGDVSGAFASGANWVGGVAPGASDDAILEPAGSSLFTVTSSAGITTVASIQTAATATLSLTGGTANAGIVFDATTGTGAGANAGTIALGSYSTLELSGVVQNEEMIETAPGHVIRHAQMELAGDTTLQGRGVVRLDGRYGSGMSATGSGVSLANVDNVIRGDGLIDLNGITLINEAKGVIDANVQDEVLQLSGASTITNSGLLESTSNEFGGLAIYATVDNSGGVILAGENTTVDITGAIIGGALETKGGAILAAHGEAVIDGLTTSIVNTGNLVVNPGATLTLEGSVRNTGAISSTSETMKGHGETSGLMNVGAAGVTLTGGGTVVNGGGDITGSGAMVNVDNTISGDGSLGTGSLELTNGAAGVIDANLGALTVQTGAFTLVNQGLMEASVYGGGSATGTLIIEGATVDGSGGGAILADGAVVDLEAATIEGGTLETSNSGTIVDRSSGSVPGRHPALLRRRIDHARPRGHRLRQRQRGHVRREQERHRRRTDRH